MIQNPVSGLFAIKPNFAEDIIKLREVLKTCLNGEIKELLNTFVICDGSPMLVEKLNTCNAKHTEFLNASPIFDGSPKPVQILNNLNEHRIVKYISHARWKSYAGPRVEFLFDEILRRFKCRMRSKIKEFLNTCLIRDGSLKPVERLNALKVQAMRNTSVIFDGSPM
jgi:hypothetical protein